VIIQRKAIFLIIRKYKFLYTNICNCKLINYSQGGTNIVHAGIGGNRMRTIGVLISGGDAPGMNAAIRAVVNLPQQYAGKHDDQPEYDRLYGRIHV
jgi:hypothetical protein